MGSILRILQEIREDSQSLERKLQDAVENQMERHARQNGNLTYSAMKEMLEVQNRECTLQMQE